MFPAAKNDWAKNAKNKAKNKTNLLQYISLFHYILPFHKMCLYKTTTKHQNYVPSYSNRLSQNNARKSQKQNKLATVHFTIYYSSTNYTFTKGHSSIKNYVSSYSKWQSQKWPKKAKTKQTCNSAFHYILLFYKLWLYKTTLEH